MKKLICLLITVMLLSGCTGGVPQKDYDSLLESKELLEAELLQTEKENKLLADELANFKEEYEILEDELANIKISVAELQSAQASDNPFSLNYSLAAIWAKSAFGDNIYYSELGTSDNVSSGSYFQCVVQSDFTGGTVDKLTEIIARSLILLRFVNVDYSTIAIKYLDSNGETLIEYSFNQNNGEYEFGVISCDISRIVDIAGALTN